ncbi:hypothetical protein [Streptacidiphilus rugosus]|uniref:hypothetical protein n=1 Tax=Streptacidiphilus rugosus TaxID=405783 RepID=UPI00056D1EBD|nr:hypothetical protein [Streptacidiphilus rugosus]
MGNTEDILNNVRAQIDAHPEPLAEARRRLDLVRSTATGFKGALRTYSSGSLAQHTFIHPVGDGDGGLVLDRRVYPLLGPDGGGQTPRDITAQLCGLLGPAVREVYPRARCGTSKRGPKLTFGQPVDGQDPTVDLVVALTRRDGSGLWIPNLEQNRWEASHPELHVEMFTSGSPSLRRTRRRIVRLLKAWNKQYSEPGFSSHNLTVWAWEFVEPGMGLATGLQTVLSRAAARVAAGSATVDPAGVSPNVQLLVSRDIAARRLRTAAEGVAQALANDSDREAVQSALSKVYYSYITNPSPSGLSARIALLRQPTLVSTASLGLGGAAVTLPSARAYGEGHGSR